MVEVQGGLAASEKHRNIISYAKHIGISKNCFEAVTVKLLKTVQNTTEESEVTRVTRAQHPQKRLKFHYSNAQHQREGVNWP